jgi:hypothetical protein
MAGDYGYGLSFQPGIAQNGNGPGGQSRGRVQEPVQILSTRLPKIFGAGAIAPGALLNAPGGMGQFAARGNVVAQALAQLAGLPPSMAPPPSNAPAGDFWPGPVTPPMPAPGPGPQLPPMRQPEAPGGYSDWIRRERDLNRTPMAPPPFQPPQTPMMTPPMPPPTIPAPRVGVGSQPPGGGAGPINPPLPPPFQGPVFPAPPPQQEPQFDQGIQSLAEALFRQWPGRGFMREM